MRYPGGSPLSLPRAVIALGFSLALGLLPALAVSPAGAQRPQGNQGLQGGQPVDNQGKDLFSGYSQLIQDAGAGWVRINFRLGSCFKNWTTKGCNGMTALQTYDQVVANAQSRNLKVLGLLSNESWIGGQEKWTALAAETTGGNGDNRYIREFGDKVARVVAGHFKGRVDHWEIWNEPNAFTTPRGWPGKVIGGSFMYPSNFAWLLKRSYDAIKGPRGANRSAVVISGGIFSYNHDKEEGDITEFNSGANYFTWTREQGDALAEWGGSCPLDGVGQHLYIDQGGAVSAQKLNDALKLLRQAYTPCKKPLQTYITEVGWGTGDGQVSPPVQAGNLRIAYETFRTIGFVARAYWFLIQDIPEAGLFYGLVSSEGAPKPSFDAYRRYATY